MQRMNNRLTAIQKKISTTNNTRFFTAIENDGIYSVTFNGTFRGIPDLKSKPLIEDIPDLKGASESQYNVYKAMYMQDCEELLIHIVGV